MADLDTFRGLLKGWLAARIPADAMRWIEERCESIAAGAPERRLFMSFSGATRYAGRAPLVLSAAELAAAGEARRGWNPAGWDCGQAARTLIVLSADVALLDKLFASADVGELVALYQALPLYPNQEAHVARCAEGVRTNMTSVFCAVAHRNPYPREWLDNAAWNQMVLKALFVGVPLWPIDGLDERANPELTSMLCDYAHERWAAGRTVSPELWRCVALEPDDAARADLKRALAGDDELCAKGAALALRAAGSEPGLDLPVDLDWKDLVA
jgi:hypothetical protein